MVTLKRTFLLAFVFGVVIVILAAVVFLRPAQDRVNLRQLADGVWVTEQIATDQVANLKDLGIKLVVDLRPDGEQAGQPTSDEVRKAAAHYGLGFAYVPVAHGDIPDATVDALQRSLASAERPVALYCRSGRRAARTWALAEASRGGGLNAAAIRAAVTSVGQSTDDHDTAIAARVAAR